MRRIVSTLGLASSLLLSTGLAIPVVAQDTAMASNSLVGTWLVEVPSEPPSLSVFGPSGTLVDLGDNAGAGVWTPTGDRTADVTIRVPFADERGVLAGYGTLRASIEVAEDGQTFAGTYTMEPPATIAEAAGLPAGQLGPNDVTGTRVVAEPMGQPVAPIPEVAPEGASPSAPPAG